MLQKKFRINPKKAWLFEGNFFCFFFGGRGRVSLTPPLLVPSFIFPEEVI